MDGQAGLGVVVVCDEPIMGEALARLVSSAGSAVKVRVSTTDALLQTYVDGTVVVAAARTLGSEIGGVLSQLHRDVGAVVVVDGRSDAATAHAFLDAGARGYLSRMAQPGEVGRAVDAVRAGRFYLERFLRDAVFARTIDGPRHPRLPRPLTAREVEVASLMATGATTKMIAAELFVSPTTAKTHLNRIYEKLGVHKRAAAVRELSRIGVLDGPVLQREDTSRHPFGREV